MNQNIGTAIEDDLRLHYIQELEITNNKTKIATTIRKPNRNKPIFFCLFSQGFCSEKYNVAFRFRFFI